MVIVGTTGINTDMKKGEEEHLGPFSCWVLGQFLYFNCSGKKYYVLVGCSTNEWVLCWCYEVSCIAIFIIRMRFVVNESLL